MCLNAVLIFRLDKAKHIVIKKTCPLRCIWLNETHDLHWRYYRPTKLLDTANYKHTFLFVGAVHLCKTFGHYEILAAENII